MYHKDQVYIRQRKSDDIWQNLHEFILLESDEEQPHPPSAFLNELFNHRRFSIEYSSDVMKQQLTHLNIRGRFYKINLQEASTIGSGYIKVHINNLHGYAFPRFINSFLEDHPITQC